jgi:hypothetical protein
MVVDHLSGESEARNTGVACIYLNHKEAENQTPAKLLSGIWRQLILGKDLGTTVKRLYQEHSEKRTTPSLNEIFNVLLPVIGKFSKVNIIVDAIDEYQEAPRQMLLDCLAELGATVNLMITSRPHITPNSSLPGLTSLEIRATEEDVRKYVDAQIQRSSRLSKHVKTRPELQDEIHSKITTSVDGM